MTEEQFIETIRSYECLYNSKLKDYKNASLKHDMWGEIAAKFKMPVSECKVKWNQLRNAFLHALARRKSVTGQGVKNLKKWKYEDEMSFLLPYMAKKTSVTKHEMSEPDRDHTQSQDHENSSGDTTEQTKKSKVYSEEKPQIMKLKRPVKRVFKRVEKDEIDLLFESMAKAVKQLPILEQIKIKMEMTKLIYQAQMRSVDSSQGDINARSVSQYVFVPSPSIENTSSPEYIVARSP